MSARRWADKEKACARDNQRNSLQRIWTESDGKANGMLEAGCRSKLRLSRRRLDSLLPRSSMALSPFVGMVRNQLAWTKWAAFA